MIDNKAEKYYSSSPYIYSSNNPILFIDFDGNDYEIEVTDKKIIIRANFVTDEASYSDVKAVLNTIKENIERYVFVVKGDNSKKEEKVQYKELEFNFQIDVNDGWVKMNDQSQGEKLVDSQTSKAAEEVGGDELKFDNSVNFVDIIKTKRNPRGAASPRVIQLTTLETSDIMHEIGHILGIAHSWGVMEEHSGSGNELEKKHISEILAKLGIGKASVLDNTGVGEGVFKEGSSNEGIKKGKLKKKSKFLNLHDQHGESVSEVKDKNQKK